MATSGGYPGKRQRKQRETLKDIAAGAVQAIWQAANEVTLQALREHEARED
ncbi:hypothetical protein [Cupriavidus necator]|uniref:hypothetical protein n=1 Tax=Cupriavidus necator TaxID=106590 RepID=UPI003F734BB1